MADKFLSRDTIKAGTTSVSLMVRLLDRTAQTPKTGIAHTDLVSASYWRQGGVRVAITLAALTNLNDAYSSGGWKEVDATNMPGWYRLDVPDAALATGADWVVVDLADDIAMTDGALVIALPTYVTLRDAIVAKVIEDQGSITLQQAISVMLSAIAGVSTSAGSVRKTPNGSATRVTATINAQNERTAITLTPSAGA